MEHKDIIRDLLEALQTAEERANKLIVSGLSAGEFDRADGYIDLRAKTREARRHATEIFRAEVRAQPIS